MGDDPLILSGIASRRLKLLLSHGVHLTPKLETICAGLPGAAPSPPTPGDRQGGGGVLLASLLPSLPVIECNAQGCTHEDGFAGSRGGAEPAVRDVCAELAASLPTLKSLKLCSGALVEIANVGRPEAVPHLARIAAAIDAPDGIALIGPCLAYNMGLALHLQPLLAGGASVKEQVRVRRYDGRMREPSQGQDFDQPPEAEARWAEVEQPSSHPVEVPIAQEVHLSVVRVPATDLFAVPKRGDGSGGVPASGTGDGGLPAVNGEGGNAAKVNPAEEEAVQAIQQHFVGGLRLVCAGDVLAVLRSGDGLREHVLSNLLTPQPGTGEHPGAAPSVLYVRVVEVLPPMQQAQAVDVNSTMVKLVGSCSSGIPVGMPGYLGALPAPPTLLGIHPAAAGMAAELQFAGALLPAWRRVAEPLVSVLHPAATVAGPARLAILLTGPPSGGKQIAITAAAAALGVHVVTLSCHDIKNNATPERTVLEGLKAAFAAAAEYRPALLVLRHLNTLGQGAHGSGDSAATRVGAVLADCIRSGLLPESSTEHTHRGLFPAPVILVACAPTADDVVPSLRRCFTHELEVDPPEQDARQTLLRSFMADAAGDSLSAEAWDTLSRHTAGLLPKDMRSLAADACSMAALQALPACLLLAASDAAPSPGASDAESVPRLAACHLDAALDHVRLRSAEDLGAPKIPDVRWDDVGGLEDVKRAILDTVELPLKHPELFSGGLRRRSGVLLYGPPGTGKTLLAKAVATEGALNFMSVKGPELINMYVGESERQIRDVFARARAARPCVVFFDELDSLAPARGRGSDSGGVMDRVVSQLLAEIDGVQGGAGTNDVFIVGATNRPDLLDPALLRPGRLDRLLYVGVASDPASQLALLRALTRKFALDEDVDLSALAERCPPRLTGADMYALCADAWMSALKRTIAQLEEAAGEQVDGQEQEEQPAVTVCYDDFVAALRELRPSLSEADIVEYEAVRDQYQSR